MLQLRKDDNAKHECASMLKSGFAKARQWYMTFPVVVSLYVWGERGGMVLLLLLKCKYVISL